MNFIIKSFGVIWEFQKKEFILLLLFRITQGFYPLLTIVTFQYLINEIQLLMSKSDQDAKKILFALFIQLLVSIFGVLLNTVNDYIFVKLSTNMDFELKSILAKKINKIKYSYFEDENFYNFLNRAQGDISSRIIKPVEYILQLIQHSITVISVMFFILSFSSLVGFLCIVLFFPILIVQMKFGRDLFNLMIFQTPFSRKHNYIYSLILDRQSNKEIRINQSFDKLIENWTNLFKKNTKYYLKLNLQQEIVSMIMEIITFVVFMLLSYLIIQKTLILSLEIASFIAIFQAVQRAQSTFNLIATIGGKLRNEKLFILDFFTLLNLDEDNIHSNTKFPIIKKEINFKNLSFSYPNSNEKVLNNINLSIKRGEKIAIIGENGSGKSTLIKCLTGLYDLDDGTIEFDGLCIKKINKNSIHNNISIIFQDFIQYFFSVKENISLGNPSANLNQIIQASKKADAHEFINKLKDKYETQLGKMFESGHDLSGGQWQKIALARSILKNSQILVLDEPTAALDPVSEAAIFDKFNEISKEKTTIFISHRMYACQHVDRIVVMKNGHIAEVGNHSDLILKMGEYYRLYNLQADMYGRKNLKTERGVLI